MQSCPYLMSTHKASRDWQWGWISVRFHLSMMRGPLCPPSGSSPWFTAKSRIPPSAEPRLYPSEKVSSPSASQDGSPDTLNQGNSMGLLRARQQRQSKAGAPAISSEIAPQSFLRSLNLKPGLVITFICWSEAPPCRGSLTPSPSSSQDGSLEITQLKTLCWAFGGWHQGQGGTEVPCIYGGRSLLLFLRSPTWKPGRTWDSSLLFWGPLRWFWASLRLHWWGQETPHLGTLPRVSLGQAGLVLLHLRLEVPPVLP